MNKSYLNLALKQSAKNNQIEQVKRFVSMGADAYVSAYAQACLHGADKCEEFLKNLIVRK